jgi:leader peptidase (prepilin peptidase) / N-methyltransferase
MPHLIYILFLFAIGASVGSFLNVVVYRLPRGMSLVSPPSHCPHCKKRLAWRDNIPVFGWMFLKGKCRYCGAAISRRYPIVEAVTGVMFVFYYVMFFIFHAGPCAGLNMAGGNSSWFMGSMTSLGDDWAIFFLYMLLLSGLLAASLIDAELYIIPASIPWWIAGIGIVVHAIVDSSGEAGSLIQTPAALALCAGCVVGLGISIWLLQARILPLSFPEGNLLDSERQELEEQVRDAAANGGEDVEIPPEYTGAQVRAEMRKEMLFLMPPLVLGGLSLLLHMHVPAVRHFWTSVAQTDWINAGLGAVLGGFVGAFTIWLTRILGSYAFGKEAMGLGDVHLMLGIGAVLGGGAAVVAFFIAPFAGILAGLYLLITRWHRQLPYGPYLSLAAAFVMLFYCPIAANLAPGLLAMANLIRQALGGV